MANRKIIITRPIWILSLVSLFTDISSEMLYPVMPLYLKSIGFSIVLIGVLEGLAEATAGLSKGYFGQLSDQKGKRIPFIRLGYGLSAISKPLMIVFAYPWWVFFARTADRLGKGIRTGARDAYLSSLTSPEMKGRVFGFHRSLDTVGAFIGPILALILLYFYPGHYTLLFLLAIVPGFISISLTYILKEKQFSPREEKKRIGFLSFLKYVKSAPKDYKFLITGLLIFALFNSSDMFLLLVLKYHGFTDISLILSYIFYNLIYAIFAYPLGIIADKVGFKKMMIAGLLLFVMVYLGFGINNSYWVFFLLLFFYGLYAASTESIGKAWISNIADSSQTATAIGAFTALNSICAMLASFWAGLSWYLWGPEFTMLISSLGVFGVIFYLYVFVKDVKFVHEKS